ncbi:MAG: hypothetical protein ACRYG8_18545 [Janthinobacterium lividum]
MRTEVQALEDLAQGHALVCKPAIEGAHQFGLTLVHDEMASNGVVTRHIMVAVWGAAALVVAVTGLLHLAAAETFAEDGALVFSDRALDLQQQLVVGIV